MSDKRFSFSIRFCASVLILLALLGQPSAGVLAGVPAQDASVPADFTLVMLPDTQYYSSKYPATYNAQTQWIVDNREVLNITFVAGMGDIVDTESSATQWTNASNAIKILEGDDPTLGIPFGLAVGNHDRSLTGTTVNYNKTFGISRFTGRPYYQGQYGSDNDSHFEFFDVGELKFITIFLEYGSPPSSALLTWANNLLMQYSDRRGIVISHKMLGQYNNSFTSEGTAVYNALRGNPNLFLMLCGHNWGEWHRSDPGAGGNIYTLEADYSNRGNLNGLGWLQYLTFSPDTNEIIATTYSPTLNQYETDANSVFSLPYTMQTTTNQSPIAYPDSAVTDNNQPIDINVLGNDTDPDGDPLVVSAVTSPANGSATFESHPTYVTYTPNPGFSGPDSFSYTISDGRGGTATAEVSIYVNPPITTYTLTINISGTGTGTVTKNPNKTTYNPGEIVTLTAKPGKGSSFTGWSGDASGTAKTITITMNSNKNITANFKKR